MATSNEKTTHCVKNGYLGKKLVDALFNEGITKDLTNRGSLPRIL